MFSDNISIKIWLQELKNTGPRLAEMAVAGFFLFACCPKASGLCSVLCISGGFSKVLEVDSKRVVGEEGRELLWEEVWCKLWDSENRHDTIAKFVLAEPVAQKVLFLQGY